MVSLDLWQETFATTVSTRQAYLISLKLLLTGKLRMLSQSFSGLMSKKTKLVTDNPEDMEVVHWLFLEQEMNLVFTAVHVSNPCGSQFL